jgi:hypothetical protein
MNPKAQALRHAKALVETDHELICCALDLVARELPELESVCKDLQKHIQQDNHPYYSLGAWMYSQFPEEFFSSREDDRALFKQCRLAWIDKMIYDLEQT